MVVISPLPLSRFRFFVLGRDDSVPWVTSNDSLARLQMIVFRNGSDESEFRNPLPLLRQRAEELASAPVICRGRGLLRKFLIPISIVPIPDNAISEQIRKIGGVNRV